LEAHILKLLTTLFGQNKACKTKDGQPEKSQTKKDKKTKVGNLGIFST